MRSQFCAAQTGSQARTGRTGRSSPRSSGGCALELTGDGAELRAEASRDPHNRELTDLVGERATRSDAFRTRWAAHDVRQHRAGTKHFHHPVVGRLDLDLDALELPADTGLTLTAYSAEPGTPSADALTLLAGRAATPSKTTNPFLLPNSPIPNSKD